MAGVESRGAPRAMLGICQPGCALLSAAEIPGTAAWESREEVEAGSVLARKLPTRTTKVLP